MDKASFTRFLVGTLMPAAARCQDGAIAFVCMDWRHMTEADGSIHPTWSPQRHQPVLRVVYAGSGYPAAIAAADGRREYVRRRH
jgi:hypothetical protein